MADTGVDIDEAKREKIAEQAGKFGKFVFLSRSIWWFDDDALGLFFVVFWGNCSERDITTLATWTTKGKSKMRVIVVRKKCHNRALDPCFFLFFWNIDQKHGRLKSCTSKYSSTKKQFTKKVILHFCCRLTWVSHTILRIHSHHHPQPEAHLWLLILSIITSSSSSPPSGQCQSVEDAPHQKLIRGDHQTKPETITAPLSFFYCLKVAPLAVGDKS